MPFNGSGTFVRAFNWVTDKINGVNITASRMDGDSDGFAAAFTNCVTRDGQGKMAADLLPVTNATYNVGITSARWQNAFFNGVVTANDFLSNNRLIIASSQSVTNTATPQAVSGLGLIPVTSGSYIIEARMILSANSNAVAGGVKVGFYATNLSFTSAVVTAVGSINSLATASAVGTIATTVAGTPSLAFPTLAAGFATNWLSMTGTIVIASSTGSPVLGINYCQNTATAGGTVTVELGTYINLIRVS